MSIIFGLLQERGAQVSELELRHLSTATERYATGVVCVRAAGRLGMGLQPYYSHLRSSMETKPLADAHGHVLSFDGRLDNYEELAELLALNHSLATDSQIVLAAFEHWGEACFAHFVGDWALALWSEKDQSLYLARDHAGARTLYFQHERNRVLWSTHLDTFTIADLDLRLAKDYVACYLASSPIRDLTPYESVRSVPPAHYLVVRNNVVSMYSHWTSTIMSTIRYKSDAEYEEHFLAVFRQSIDRRTGAGAPILAQLSGGMDSTAIVCMSDHIRRSTAPHTEILDTVSFYDDSEASLNERPYFSITEAKRGKVGTHIDMAFSQRTFEPHDATEGAYLLPGADSFSIHQERWFDLAVWQRGYRSILSGIGGDEVLGGVPIAFPELADYLVSGNIRKLFRQSVAWSLIDRSPLLGMLYGTLKCAVDLYVQPKPRDRTIPPWIASALLKESPKPVTERSTFPSRLGVAPHRLDNCLAWSSIMETLPHVFPQRLFRPEYRYPFLDKDLVNFLFSIPRDQVLRPGRRRSLMRRSLVGIVPDEILERRRKAFQLRAPLSALQDAQPVLEQLFSNSIVASAGFVDVQRLRVALTSITQGSSEHWQGLLRTIAFELWLKSIHYGIGHHSHGMEDRRNHLSLTV